jgi:hypothetical protein
MMMKSGSNAAVVIAKKIVLPMVALFSFLPSVGWATDCIVGGVITAVANEPSPDVHSWSIYVKKSATATTATKFNADSSGYTISLDKPAGIAVFNIAVNAYSMGSTVTISDTTGNNCGPDENHRVFNVISLQQ